MICIISTLSWRREALLKVLDSIAANTVLPEYVCVIGDGLADIDPGLYPFRLYRPVEQPHEIGAWFRFKYTVDNHPGRDADLTIVCFLDDDHLVPDDYFEKSLDALTRSDAVSWSARLPDSTFVHATEERADDTEIVFMCASTMTTRIGFLRHAFSSPLGSTFAVKGSQDEAFISYWHWIRGKRMTRPAGCVNVIELPEATDPRSTHVTHGKLYDEHKTLLRTRYGWPQSGPVTTPRHVNGRVRR